MKVTPVGKKFGSYSPGDVFEFPDTPAKALIKIKKLAPADGELTSKRLTYNTRALVATPATQIDSVEVDSAGVEWDASSHTSTKLKNSDGTWRKKPGRAAA
jgi:hypothetical protein